jgi:hypothetical protein
MKYKTMAGLSIPTVIFFWQAKHGEPIAVIITFFPDWEKSSN